MLKMSDSKQADSLVVEDTNLTPRHSDYRYSKEKSVANERKCIIRSLSTDSLRGRNKEATVPSFMYEQTIRISAAKAYDSRSEFEKLMRSESARSPEEELFERKHFFRSQQLGSNYSKLESGIFRNITTQTVPSSTDDQPGCTSLLNRSTQTEPLSTDAQSGVSGCKSTSNQQRDDIWSPVDPGAVPIGESEQIKIIEKIQELRRHPEFCLRIPNLTIDANFVIIYYLRKRHGDIEYQQTPSESSYSSASGKPDDKIHVEDMECARYISIENYEEDSSSKTGEIVKNVINQGDSDEDNSSNLGETPLHGPVPDVYDVMRDTSSLRKVVRNIVPHAIVDLIEIKKFPCFQPTAGLSSSLMHTDNNLNEERRVGCITALFIGARTSKYFALTAGHTVNIGEKICIVQSDKSTKEIGTVIEKICENQEKLDYIDAAVIELYESSIEDLNLKQQFLIDDVSYRLSAFQVDYLEKGRVILRAIDNDNIKGIILSACLNILEGPRTPMYRCTQVMRYSEDGNHGGAIHSDGQSGLLGTFEPTPDEGNVVKPVVMLIGLYPVYNRTGELVSHSSVGVDLRRVLGCLAKSVRVNEDLQVDTINI